jgi:hypothetical protein
MSCFGAGPLSDWSLDMASNLPAENRPASSETPLQAGGHDVETFLAIPRTAIDQRAPTEAPASPASSDRRQPQGTRSTHRQLVSRGFTPGEAANLTAYLNRLPIGDQPWTLTQVNTVLFLRGLRVSGRFGPTDGHSLD